VVSRLLGRRLLCGRCKREWQSIPPATVKALDELDFTDMFTVDLSVLGDEDRIPTSQAVPPPADDRWLGKRLGRYQIQSILGSGSMGHVYRATDPTLQRDVALKVLPQPFPPGTVPFGLRLFLQEARAAAKLQHPNVVTIYEVNQDGGYYFIAMELIVGGTLMQVMQTRRAPIHPVKACYMLSGVARALAEAHRNDIVHRDLKPGNLMINAQGQIKVTDFGLADAGEVDAQDRVPRRIVGSPGWIAPEVARAEPATPASDVYSLGLILYFTLTARRPLWADTVGELIDLCKHPPKLDPSQIVPEVPPRLVEICDRCLEHSPRKRYLTADDLAHDLKEVVMVESSSAGFVPPSTADSGSITLPAEAPRRPLWQRATIVLASILVILGAILLQVVIWRWIEERFFGYTAPAPPQNSQVQVEEPPPAGEEIPP
jgi:serine/threonine protein kinase